MNTKISGSGIGLKAQHYEQLINEPTSTPWLEIHPENYMGAGGPPHRYLSKLRENYGLSMHGVGMSLGSADGIDPTHLERLKLLANRYEPELVSEHLSWSHWNEWQLNDLLPLPYTTESMQVIADNIDKVQSCLGRCILIENPSTYIKFRNNEFNEPELLKILSEQTGCKILLDINNVFVSSMNNDEDPLEYIKQFDLDNVHEIHLAGHSQEILNSGKTLRIDDHGSAVSEAVWKLFEYTIKRANRDIPTLIEWDTNIPDLSTLLAQAKTAESKIASSLAQPIYSVLD